MISQNLNQRLLKQERIFDPFLLKNSKNRFVDYVFFFFVFFIDFDPMGLSYCRRVLQHRVPISYLNSKYNLERCGT